MIKENKQNIYQIQYPQNHKIIAMYNSHSIFNSVYIQLAHFISVLFKNFRT